LCIDPECDRGKVGRVRQVYWIAVAVIAAGGDDQPGG
jgi:hypothetical protein